MQRSTRNADGSWQSYVVIDSTAANQAGYADDDVVAGTAYQYHIRACDLTLCSTFAATPVVTPGLTPAAPANIVLSATGPTSVAVAWTDKSSNETSFDLQRRSRNPDGTYGRYSVIAAPAANTTHYADSGLTEGVTYQYRLRACNAGGCSLFVTSKTIIAEVKPAPPANVQAVATSSASVTVSWSDGSSNEADFQLQRRMRNPAGGYGAFADVIRPSANATSYGDSGLVAATSYQYRIRSCNLAGCSVFVSSNYVKTQN